MKSLKFLIPLLLVAIMLSSCGSAEDPQAVADAYHAAMDAGDIEAVMATIAEDAVFRVPVGRLSTTVDIRQFHEQSIEEEVTAKASNFDVRGNAVVFDFELDLGDIVVSGQTKITVEDDKIIEYHFSMSPGYFDD